MNLYLIYQESNTQLFDVWDSAVVAAESEEVARGIHPGGSCYDILIDTRGWALPSDVQVTFIGVASDDLKRGIVCSSFNAG